MYAHVDALKNCLRGVDLSALSRTDFAESTDAKDSVLQAEISGAETWAEGFCQETFRPLTCRTDVLNGRGTPTLLLRHAPIFDVIQVTVRRNPLTPAQTFSSGQFFIDRKAGKLAFIPALVLQTFSNMGPIFETGKLNVVAQYRTGFAILGDNVGATGISTLMFDRVASVTTDGTVATFSLPTQMGLYKRNELLTEAAPTVMLKNGVDDSANWTMRTPDTLDCPIASYSAGATYVLCYVPAAIEDAVVKKAASEILVQLSAKSGKGGSGGAMHNVAGPFQSHYGLTGQYGNQIEAFQKGAEESLQPFRRMRS